MTNEQALEYYRTFPTEWLQNYIQHADERIPTDPAWTAAGKVPPFLSDMTVQDELDTVAIVLFERLVLEEQHKTKPLDIFDLF